MKVEEFVDLCVAVWEVYVFGGGRGEVGWVIDVSIVVFFLHLVSLKNNSKLHIDPMVGNPSHIQLLQNPTTHD